ncbi:MAG: hypothetical protein OER93_03560 [Thermoleophilia bacterium]|nr:hypothetical protein [Thermoleophilia bacterium]
MRSHLRDGKRFLLAAVVASLCLTAAIAIGILLFGQFGPTQGRILLSTLLAGGYGLLAVPATVLIDQERDRRLAIANAALAAAGLALMLGLVWSDDPPTTLVRSAVSVTACAAAAGQIAALTARRRRADPPSVRRAFAGSSVTALALAAMVVVAIWLEIDTPTYYRVLGALAVLDVLLVTLQPILAKMHTEQTTHHHLRLHLDAGGPVEVTAAGADFSRAVASAIRQAEGGGGRVVRIDRIGSPVPTAASVAGAVLPDSLV